LAQAEKLFRELRTIARTNAGDFDYWLEGVAHTAFCAAFSLAVLRDRLAHEAGALKAQLTSRRDATRDLFAATFPPASVEGELAVRYAFHEAVIDSATA